MSPIALGLDLLLAGLLTAALMMGAQLNAKLKALRESHASFAKAVGQLDVAAVRAESALSAIRTASETAHDDLLNRIETARSLAAKLERANADAQKALEEGAKAQAARPMSLAALATRPRALRPQPSNDREPPVARKAATPAAPARKPLRSIFDEDLFGKREGERLRLFGGRRK
jgi:hypothetical protein